MLPSFPYLPASGRPVNCRAGRHFSKSPRHTELYNLSGKEVATLVNGHIKAGFHQVYFDGSNLSAGTYVYVLQAGDFKAVKKMVFLK